MSAGLTSVSDRCVLTLPCWIALQKIGASMRCSRQDNEETLLMLVSSPATVAHFKLPLCGCGCRIAIHTIRAAPFSSDAKLDYSSPSTLRRFVYPQALSMPN